MPFNKRTVEPICLSQVQIAKDVPNELECVANHTCANVIRQLSSLSAHAQDLFEELINDAGHIFQRTEALHGRIERLKRQVTQLDSNVEEVTIQDVNNRKPFVSVTRIDQQVVNRATMPKSLHLLYEQAEPAPALHLLNPYRDDGRDSMKFYTDPSFFFNLWMQSMIQFPQNHHGHRSGKHERHRSPKGQQHQQESIYATNPTSSSQARLIQQTSEEQQYRSPQELVRHRNDFDQTNRGTIRSQMHQQQIYSPSNPRQLMQYPNNNHLNYHPDLVQYGSPTLLNTSSMREHQPMTMHFNTSTPESISHVPNGYNGEQSPRFNVHSPMITRQAPVPPPPPPLLSSQFDSTNHMSHHSMMRQTITRPSTSPPPPPPPPPIPPPAPPPPNIGMVTLATISEIDSLPPPPADFIEHSPSPPPPPPPPFPPSSHAPPPPAPPMPSNIPPAPPLPNSAIQSLVMRPSEADTSAKLKNNVHNHHHHQHHNSSSHTDDVSMTSETSIQDQRPYISRDLHSDLLDEIKKGIQLNNRKKEEEKKAAAAAVTTKTPSLNVMAIMEQAAKYRRDKIRPQSESENDDESSRWDDSE